MRNRLSLSLLVMAGVAAAMFAAVPAMADGYRHRGHGGPVYYYFGPPAYGFYSPPRRHRSRTVVVYQPLVVAPGTTVILTRLAPRDRLYVVNVLETARTGQRVAWVNPDVGAQYAVTPTRTYYAAGGQPCREYSMTGEIGGHEQELVGTACRQADGSWRVAN